MTVFFSVRGGVGSIAAGLCLGGAMPAIAADLAPHRAIYDVVLSEASERSGISDMRGRIAYEFRGSACEGYTTNFRFVTQIAVRGAERVTDQQTTTYEAGDGSMFRYVTRTFVDRRLDLHVEGTAMRTDEGIVVDRTEPVDDELTLPPAMFPTEHMIDLIERAEAGERFYEAPIYDGSDEGDRVLTTTVVVGPEKRDEADDPDAIGALADEPFRNVSVAYFDPADLEGEGLPDYRIAFKMHDSGITRSLEMDYGDFVIEGTMEELELLEADECD
ncbi:MULTISPECIES: cell envelope integrity EipB family protein [unclassified Roseitalea]|uniref:cell envelope integrity EipB family protein n=1 Tax=unclassified Roseitalea TaxID=2639107 RepID=UPI00273EC398|nr:MULTISPECIES: cell envelope integrity EipB family protein [unclassified Roseitalea]